jgi:hypothetical protein
MVEQRRSPALFSQADVHQRPPEPALQPVELPQLAPRAKSARERLLHGVSSCVDVAENPSREPEEATKVIVIDPLDRTDDLIVRQLAYNP